MRPRPSTNGPTWVPLSPPPLLRVLKVTSVADPRAEGPVWVGQEIPERCGCADIIVPPGNSWTNMHLFPMKSEEAFTRRSPSPRGPGGGGGGGPASRDVLERSCLANSLASGPMRRLPQVMATGSTPQPNIHQCLTCKLGGGRSSRSTAVARVPRPARSCSSPENLQRLRAWKWYHAEITRSSGSGVKAFGRQWKYEKHHIHRPKSH